MSKKNNKAEKSRKALFTRLSQQVEGKVFKHYKYRRGQPFYFVTSITIYELDNVIFPSGNLFVKIKGPEKQSFTTPLTPIGDSCARFNQTFTMSVKLVTDKDNTLQPYVIRCSLRRENHDRVYDKIGTVQFNLSEFADSSRNEEVVKAYLTTGSDYSTLKIGVTMKLVDGEPTYFVPVEDSVIGLSFGSIVVDDTASY